MARAGRGKRWSYQLGVGRVKVPGKRRVKSPGYGAIRRRMSRGSSARPQGFSTTKAVLALMTGGISLAFTGSPFGDSAEPSPRVRATRSNRVRATHDPSLQVAIDRRLATQVARAQTRLVEIELELEQTREELWVYETSNQLSQVRTRKLRIAQLAKLRNKWLEQLELLGTS